ncbi:MAG: sulfotransferase [Gammaproteobacteria bacterium]|nr:sulfotransferase [Gammaproteobacteria bacterium]
MAQERNGAWTPPPRPEWVARVNEEGRSMDIASLVPLQPGELLETAMRNTGLSDFGSGEWREPFEVLVKSLEEEAELNLFGRLMTRSDLLIWLQERLEIEEAYRRHPEIDAEVLAEPVFIVGQPRSGTSILFELLSQDAQFGVPTNWEIMFPCPPPEAATYRTDPRIARAEHLLTQWYRVAPTFRTMHELGATIPNECKVAMNCTFVSDNLTGIFQVPGYYAWLMKADLTYPYAYYRRMLKLLQWRNPRRYWLLKSPSHIWSLPTLFKVFPDARVIYTHRDPIVTRASVTNLLGTIYWMRSDKVFDAEAFERVLEPEGVAAGMNLVIDQIEKGEIPRARIHDFQFADLIERPIEAVRSLYDRAGLQWTAAAQAGMEAYLAHKPKGKFGAHRYEVSDGAQIERERRLYARYQRFHGVRNEV